MSNSIYRIVLRSVCLPLVLLFASSCTKEDVSMCNQFTGLHLQYEYTLNSQYTNLFGQDVNRMAIYIFDQDNLFYDEIVIDQAELLGDDHLIDIPLAPGKYTLLSWGGDMTTYNVGDMVEPTIPTSFKPYLTKGVTTLEDFRLMIQYVEGDMGELVVVDAPADLYYGVLPNAEVNANQITKATIDLKKNTNLLKVIISGINNLQSPFTRAPDADSPLEVYCTSPNGRYKWDNQIGEYARSVKYTPDYVRLDGDRMEVEMKVMHLSVENHSAGPTQLVIKDPVSGTILYDKDVVNEILNLKDDNGNYVYSSQEDLYREDVYNISVNINRDLSVTIIINGWATETIVKPL